MRDPLAWRVGHRAAEPIFFWSAVGTSLPASLAIVVFSDERLYVAFLLITSAFLVVGPSLACVAAHRAASASVSDHDG